MGLACADFDGNGFLDIAVTNFTYEYTTLYENKGDQFLVDSSQRLGLVAATHTSMGWGMGFFDYNNDGYADARTLTDASGEFKFTPVGIPTSSGVASVRARVLGTEVNSAGIEYTTLGGWSDPLEWTQLALPAITRYELAHDTSGVSTTEARTVATITLFLVALWVLAILARPARRR